jgi:ribonuclease E
MEDSRNDRDVEKRIRDAVKNDRARVQIGKISQFGLLEMSRQRLRAGVVAGSTVPCPHCGGQGIVRSVESTALRLLRALEEEGQKLKASAVAVRIASDVAIYTLNQKRRELARIEADYGMAISFDPKEGLMVGTFEIERTAQMTPEERAKFASAVETEFVPPPVEDEVEDIVEPDDEEENEVEEVTPASQQTGAQPQPGASPSKRRRRRRGGRSHSSGERPPQSDGTQHSHPPAQLEQPAAQADVNVEGAIAPSSDALAPQNDGTQPTIPGQPAAPRKRRRRRGKRGGSSHSSTPQNGAASTEQSAPRVHESDRFGPVDEVDTTPSPEPVSRPDIVMAPVAAPNASSTPVWSLTADTTSHPASAAAESVPAPESERVKEAAEAEANPGPTKKGWWQRTFRSDE